MALGTAMAANIVLVCRLFSWFLVGLVRVLLVLFFLLSLLWHLWHLWFLVLMWLRRFL